MSEFLLFFAVLWLAYCTGWLALFFYRRKGNFSASIWAVATLYIVCRLAQIHS